MTVLQDLAIGLVAAVSDGRVWLGIAGALGIGAACTVLGIATARVVGLLRAGATAAEVLGVGLACGLLVLTALWATVRSAGQTAYAPVAIGFVLAILIALRSRRRRGCTVDAGKPQARRGRERPGDRSQLVRASLVSAVFLAGMGLIYGTAMVPSPRNDAQPVEFLDTAFYSVLGADLAETGVESIYSPSGFDVLPGIPTQSWYHWGEMWLAAAAITTLGAEPLIARHYIALPLMLLAVAALTGGLVRRLGGGSRQAFIFGVVASLLLAPFPLPGPFFAHWARWMVFGITMYGLAAVTVLLIAIALLELRARPSRPLALFTATAVASLLASHIVIAFLALVGTTAVTLVHFSQSLARRRRLPPLQPRFATLLASSAGLLGVTLAWGLLTGHGIAASGLSSAVAPFNSTWVVALVLTTVGSCVFLLIPIAWFGASREGPERSLYLGTMAILVAGAIGWGARLGDFTMFHVFYGGIAVFGTPVAAIAVWNVWRRLVDVNRRRLAATLVIITVVQIDVGVVAGLQRLRQFGADDYPPIPVAVLEGIKELPEDAKLAYSCGPFEELAFWNATLISIDAHTGRPVIPMCFQAELFAGLVGGPVSLDNPSPLYDRAPQRALYPNADAEPSPGAVLAFMRQQSIDFIYADRAHPNNLVPEAAPVISAGDVQVLAVP